MSPPYMRFPQHPQQQGNAAVVAAVVAVPLDTLACARGGTRYHGRAAGPRGCYAEAKESCQVVVVRIIQVPTSGCLKTMWELV